MSHRSFPKEGVKKLNHTIRDLKAELRKKDKEIQFLRNELENIMKPSRDRKTHVDKNKLDYDAWRKDFVQRFKKEVLKKDE